MNVKKNYVYNLMYQIFILLVPIVTGPYISRVFKPEGIGINTGAFSTVQYFVLAGTVGIGLYGTRTIAYIREDQKKLNETFWNIFILKLITTTIAFFLYIAFVYFFIQSNQIIFYMQSIYIISAMMDITWLLAGLEDFKHTVLRNFFVRITSVVLLFLLVRKAEDLWIYVLILTFSELFGQLTLWIQVPKIITKFSVSFKLMKKHFLPSLILFIPQIATQIYVVLNKSMLFYMSTATSVGLFESADKIIKMTLSIVTALGTVMLPRIANLYLKSGKNEVVKYIYKTFDLSSYISIPIMFGVAGIASSLVPWYFGPGFEKTTLLISIISPIILFIAWSNVIGQQYLIPVGKNKEYTISVIFGAVINLVLNLILIKRFNSVGASVATLISEIGVTILQLYLIKEDFNFKKLFTDSYKYLLSGLIMFLIVYNIGKYIGVGSIYVTFLQIIIGVVVYVLVLILLKSKTNQFIINNISTIIHRKK